MRNLLSAGFHRLFRYWLFWITLVGYMVMCGSVVIDRYRMYRKIEESLSIDAVLFDVLPSFGFFLAVLVSIFLGDEFKDGTVRNKIIAGYTRTKIYCSSLLVVAAASILEMLAGIIVCWGGGLLLFDGGYSMNGKQILMNMILTVFVMVAYSALFTAVTLVIGNRTGAIAGCLLLTGVMLFSVILITSRLDEPKKRSDMVITANGVEEGPEEDNPLYVDGAKRKAMTVTLRILPTGQVASIDMGQANYGFLVYSGIVILFLTVGGGMIFYRKDIR